MEPEWVREHAEKLEQSTEHLLEKMRRDMEDIQVARMSELLKGK